MGETNSLEMESLILTVNKLQSVFNTIGSSGIDLPQIVVVGEQSAGKSSVLENIVGRPCLPRGTGIVTRCPIVIQLNRIPEGASSSSSNDGHRGRSSSGSANAKEWAKFPHLPEGNQIVTNFDEIADIINTEVKRRAGESKGIVEEQIIMSIHSPNVINLTVIDLPGITENSTEGQPEDMPKQINDLIMNYISNPKSIILTVSTATSDLANSSSIRLARLVDSNFDRTIAVITKLDLMDTGTDATDVLTGKLIKVKLGIIGVVNRSFEDIKNRKSIQESLEKETQFLQENYPQLASQHGTGFLRTRLQRQLMEHIRISLAPMQSHIAKTIVQEKQRLADMGEDIPEDKADAMMNVIEKFCLTYRSVILGKTREIEKDTLTGGARISQIFEVCFPKSVEAINPLKDLADNRILNTVWNSKPLEASMIIAESPFQDLTREQILRLEIPALELAETLNTEMINVMEKTKVLLEKQLSRFPKLCGSITLEVTEILSTRNMVAQKMLQDFVRIHASFIKTHRPEFNMMVAERMSQCVITKDKLGTEPISPPTGPKPSAPGNVEGKPRVLDPQANLCLTVREMVNYYFLIVKETFLDYCPKVLAYAVIYYLQENMQQTLMKKLYTPEKIEALVQENSLVAEDRARIKTTLEQLIKANEIILEVKEGDA